jgi:hypothetical protein
MATEPNPFAAAQARRANAKPRQNERGSGGGVRGLIADTATAAVGFVPGGQAAATGLSFVRNAPRIAEYGKDRPVIDPYGPASTRQQIADILKALPSGLVAFGRDLATDPIAAAAAGGQITRSWQGAAGGALLGGAGAVVRNAVDDPEGGYIPLTRQMGQSFSDTAGRIANPSRYLQASEEGRIVGTLLEDIGNASIVGSVASRGLSGAASRASNPATAARLTEVAERVGNAARLGDQLGAAPATVFTAPAKAIARMDVGGQTVGSRVADMARRSAESGAIGRATERFPRLNPQVRSALAEDLRGRDAQTFVAAEQARAAQGIVDSIGPRTVEEGRTGPLGLRRAAPDAAEQMRLDTERQAAVLATYGMADARLFDASPGAIEAALRRLNEDRPIADADGRPMQFTEQAYRMAAGFAARRLDPEATARLSAARNTMAEAGQATREVIGVDEAQLGDAPLSGVVNREMQGLLRKAVAKLEEANKLEDRLATVDGRAQAMQGNLDANAPVSSAEAMSLGRRQAATQAQAQNAARRVQEANANLATKVDEFRAAEGADANAIRQMAADLDQAIADVDAARAAALQAKRRADANAGLRKVTGELRPRSRRAVRPTPSPADQRAVGALDERARVAEGGVRSAETGQRRAERVLISEVTKRLARDVPEDVADRAVRAEVAAGRVDDIAAQADDLAQAPREARAVDRASAEVDAATARQATAQERFQAADDAASNAKVLGSGQTKARERRLIRLGKIVRDADKMRGKKARALSSADSLVGKALAVEKVLRETGATEVLTRIRTRWTDQLTKALNREGLADLVEPLRNADGKLEVGDPNFVPRVLQLLDDEWSDVPANIGKLEADVQKATFDLDRAFASRDAQRIADAQDALAKAERDVSLARARKQVTETLLPRYQRAQRQALMSSFDKVAEAAPARYRTAMVGQRRAVLGLLEEADRLDAEIGWGAGNMLRETAMELPTSLKALVESGLDPVYVTSGLGIVTKPSMRDKRGRIPTEPEVAPTQRRETALIPSTPEQALDNAYGAIRAHIRKGMAEQFDQTYGKPATEVLKADGTPVLSGAVTRLTGADLVNQMASEGWVPYDRKLGLDVPAGKVTPATRFIPEKLATALDNYMANEYRGSWIGGPDSLLGQFNRKWKTWILPLSLRWHVGNVVGNALLMGGGAGMSPKQIVSMLAEIKGGNTWKELYGEFPEEIVLKNGRTVKVDRRLFDSGLTYSEKVVMGRLDDVALEPRTPIGKFINESYRFNQLVDNMGRTAVYLQKIADAENNPKLRRILAEKGVSPEEYAMKQALRAMGDYANMTPFERNIVRNVLPFYAWMRHITVLSLSLPVYHPQRVVLLGHLANEFGQDQSELPDMFKGGYFTEGGSFMDLRALNPFGDAAAGGLFSLESLARATSPGVKIPTAALTGLGLQRGFERVSRPQGTGDLDAYGREKATPLYNRPTELLNYAMTQVPQARQIRTMLTGNTAYYDTGQTYRNLEGNADSPTKRFVRPALALVGANTFYPDSTAAERAVQTQATTARRISEFRRRAES